MFATGPFRIRHLVSALSPGRGGGNCLSRWLIFKCLPDPLNPRGVPGFPHGSEGRLLAQPLVAVGWAVVGSGMEVEEVRRKDTGSVGIQGHTERLAASLCQEGHKQPCLK